MSRKSGQNVSHDTLGADMSNVQAINTEINTRIGREASKNLEVNIQDVVIPRCYQHALPQISMADIDKVRKTGVLMTIVVRTSLDIPGTYEVCYGVSSWRTAILSGLETIDIEVRDWLSDDEQLEMLEFDYEQSEAPDPIKDALSIAKLKKDEDLNNAQVAERLGRRREDVSHTLRLLKLDPLVKTWLSDGKITAGHARALVTLGSEDQKTLGKQIQADRMTVRAVELAAKEIREGQGASTNPVKSDANVEHLRQELSEHLCSEVEIQHDGPGGELRIKYYDLEILEGILEKLGLNNH